MPEQPANNHSDVPILDVPSTREPAKDGEKVVSLFLASVAVGLIGAALANGFDAMAQVRSVARFAVVLLGVVGISSLIASGFFGLWGIVNGPGVGVGNDFDRQTKLLGIGFLALVGGLTVSAYYQVSGVEEFANQISNINAKLSEFESTATDRLSTLEKLMNDLQDENAEIADTSAQISLEISELRKDIANLSKNER